jgi:hypothetical protein
MTPDHQDTKDTKITRNGGGRVNGTNRSFVGRLWSVPLVPWRLGVLVVKGDQPQMDAD